MSRVDPPDRDKIIEKMARALCKWHGDDWNREGPGGLDSYRDMAGAAYSVVRKRLTH